MNPNQSEIIRNESETVELIFDRFPSNEIQSVAQINPEWLRIVPIGSDWIPIQPWRKYRILYLVWWKTAKNQSDLIRLIPRHQSDESEPIRNQVFNPNQSDFGFIRIDSDWKFGLHQSEIGLIWIENLVSDWFRFILIDVSELIGLIWIDFWPFYLKRDTKRFSDWFASAWIQILEWIGIVLIDSEWISIRYFRQGVQELRIQAFKKQSSVNYTELFRIKCETSRKIIESSTFYSEKFCKFSRTLP